VPANADSLSAADSAFTNVRVFYGTTRARVDRPTPEEFYGPNAGQNLELGIATVSVPARHRPGEIETRGRRWQTLFLTRDRADPKKFMLIRRIDTLAETTWTAAFRQAVDSAPSKEVLVYVHGFNNSFSAATLRAAQLVYDVKPGESVVAMFSWPSKAELRWYTADEDAVQVALPAFKRFLLALVDSTGAQRVQIVGHSMGTRMIATALKDLADSGRVSVVSDVVLAAADINAQVFRDQIAPALTRAARRVTMYTSTGDRALLASHTIHNDLRAGEDPRWLSSVAGVDVIDATRAKADWLDHGYVTENKRLLDDLFMLLARGLAPDKRNLRRVERDSVAKYWMVP
jgi:esterase/lipase superfamily enzyme